MPERQLFLLLVITVFVNFGEVHRAVVDCGNFGVAGPLDVPIAKLRFHESLGVTDTVEPEVACIGFRRHEVHRHPVPDLALFQLGIEDERVLVKTIILDSRGVPQENTYWLSLEEKQ